MLGYSTVGKDVLNCEKTACWCHHSSLPSASRVLQEMADLGGKTVRAMELLSQSLLCRSGDRSLVPFIFCMAKRSLGVNVLLVLFVSC